VTSALPIGNERNVPHFVLPESRHVEMSDQSAIAQIEIAFIVIVVDPLPCTVVGKGSNYTYLIGTRRR
jgi:hypothetical protein